MTAFSTKVAKTQKDIFWFYCCSSADCHELSSNFGAFVSACLVGAQNHGQAFIIPYESSHLRSINKKRIIEHRLLQLTPRFQKILCSTFANLSYPMHYDAYFGQFAGAALNSPLATQYEVYELLHSHYHQKPSPANQTLLIKIKERAILDYTNAIEAYHETYTKRNT